MEVATWTVSMAMAVAVLVFVLVLVLVSVLACSGRTGARSVSSPRQAARRVGGPVLWTVPSGKRIVNSRLGPSVRSHPASCTLVW